MTRRSRRRQHAGGHSRSSPTPTKTRTPGRRDPTADPTPVLAGIGPLQFDVAVDRLKGEFGVTVTLHATNWTVARRTDGDGAKILRANRHADILYRSDGSLMALFTSDFMLARFQRQHPDVTLDRMLTRWHTGGVG